MNDETLYALVSLGSLLIVLFIARAIFSISKILSYQKAQLLLLAQIAKQLGVPANNIEGVVLERLYKQKNSGTITETQFEQEKKRLLGE